MDVEELRNRLIDEAQAGWNKLNMYKRFLGREFSYYDGYIDCGVEKEKCIMELKEENAELKEKLEKETDHRIRNFNKSIEWKEKHRKQKIQLTEAKEIIKELSKSLFLAKGLIRDLCDDTVVFEESKERALYCYNQKHLDVYKKAEAFIKE